MILHAFFFRRAVRQWCIDIRLCRELEKEIKRLCVPTNNQMLQRLNAMALDLYVPNYCDLLVRLAHEHEKRKCLKSPKLSQ